MTILGAAVKPNPDLSISLNVTSLYAECWDQQSFICISENYSDVIDYVHYRY